MERGEHGGEEGERADDSHEYREHLAEYKLEEGGETGAGKVGAGGGDFEYGEEFRAMVLEEYGPDGRGEGIPDWDEVKEVEPGQLHLQRVEGPAKEEGNAPYAAMASKEIPEPDDTSEGKTSVDVDDAEPSKVAAQANAIEEAEVPARSPVDPPESISEVANPSPRGTAEVSAATAEEIAEAAATKIENISQNDSQIVVTEQEGPEGPGKPPPTVEVETRDFHHFPAGARGEGAEEVRTFEAVDYGKGDVARIPKTDLEREGFEPEPGKNAIVRLGLRDVESEGVETVFARYNSSDRRAEAYVDDIGGEKGSRYELVEASRYDEDRFVRDFERGKCEHLQNVRLEHAKDRMFVVVDERRVELSNHRLTTSGAHAVLRGKLGDDNCKIEFDGRRVSVKSARDYPVEMMRMDGDELVVRYSQSRSEKHEHRTYLEHLQSPEKPTLNQFGRQEMLEHVKMFDHPERVEGTYQFVLDRTARAEIGRLLAEAKERGNGHYNKAKAEISERLVPNMLELTGWEKVKWHPFERARKEGSSAHGADWLLRTPDGRLALVEVKWWIDDEGAAIKGQSQLAKNLYNHPEYNGERIVEAYLAIVQWDADDSPMRVYIKKILPEVRLA